MFPSRRKILRRRMYGYSSGSSDFDLLTSTAKAAVERPWLRPFEVQAFSKAPQTLTDRDRDFFIEGATHGFKHIAQRHGFTPSEMWEKVEEGLKAVGMHADDLDDVQLLVFGWKPLTTEMLERYRWRYPDRCPLLDVLCTLDDTCEKLNAVQDWMLELKGAKNRRRLDILPELPKTDAVRPPVPCL